jgi:hypothetical protein
MELLGLKPGAEVGRMIGLLQDAQTKKDVTTKAEAREWLKTLKPDSE